MAKNVSQDRENIQSLANMQQLEYGSLARVDEDFISISSSYNNVKYYKEREREADPKERDREESNFMMRNNSNNRSQRPTGQFNDVERLYEIMKQDDNEEDNETNLYNHMNMYQQSNMRNGQSNTPNTNIHIQSNATHGWQAKKDKLLLDFTNNLKKKPTATVLSNTLTNANNNSNNGLGMVDMNQVVDNKSKKYTSGISTQYTSNFATSNRTGVHDNRYFSRKDYFIGHHNHINMNTSGIAGGDHFNKLEHKRSRSHLESSKNTPNAHNESQNIQSYLNIHRENDKIHNESRRKGSYMSGNSERREAVKFSSLVSEIHISK